MTGWGFFIFLLDLFPHAPTNCPCVSEDSSEAKLSPENIASSRPAAPGLDPRMEELKVCARDVIK